MDEHTSEPLRRVLGRLGLMEFEEVDLAVAEAGAVLRPDEIAVATRLLVACLEAQHRLMVRRIAGKVGENLQEYAALREMLGL
jgi:hypothetical protein